MEKKIKRQVYLNSEMDNKLTQVYGSRIVRRQKTTFSDLLEEAIVLLEKAEQELLKENTVEKLNKSHIYVDEFGFIDACKLIASKLNWPLNKVIEPFLLDKQDFDLFLGVCREVYKQHPEHKDIFDQMFRGLHLKMGL